MIKEQFPPYSPANDGAQKAASSACNDFRPIGMAAMPTESTGQHALVRKAEHRDARQCTLCSMTDVTFSIFGMNVCLTHFHELANSPTKTKTALEAANKTKLESLRMIQLIDEGAHSFYSLQSQIITMLLNYDVIPQATSSEDIAVILNGTHDLIPFCPITAVRDKMTDVVNNLMHDYPELNFSLIDFRMIYQQLNSDRSLNEELIKVVLGSAGLVEGISIDGDILRNKPLQVLKQYSRTQKAS